MIDIREVIKMVTEVDNEKIYKALAVMGFVNAMIGAFEAGFVEKNNPTLSEIYRVAQNHVKDNYNFEFPNIIDQWGSDIAKECGLEIKK